MAPKPSCVWPVPCAVRRISPSARDSHAREGHCRYWLSGRLCQPKRSVRAWALSVASRVTEPLPLTVAHRSLLIGTVLFLLPTLQRRSHWLNDRQNGRRFVSCSIWITIFWIDYDIVSFMPSSDQTVQRSAGIKQIVHSGPGLLLIRADELRSDLCTPLDSGAGAKRFRNAYRRRKWENLRSTLASRSSISKWREAATKNCQIGPAPPSARRIAIVSRHFVFVQGQISRLWPINETGITVRGTLPRSQKAKNQGPKPKRSLLQPESYNEQAYGLRNRAGSTAEKAIWLFMLLV